MTLYAPLTAYLEDSRMARLPVTFADVEAILGRSLPETARRHRSWWSNNPTNNVMTAAWLAAGYRTEQVDMDKQTLVFVRAEAPAAGSVVREAAPAGFIRDAAPLSPRARAFLGAGEGAAAEAAAVAVIEAAAARAARRAVLSKYAGARLGEGGSDSAELIREDRDAR